MRAVAHLLVGISLFAAPVQAQDFLGALARRAAASVATQAVGRAIAGQVSQAPASTPAPALPAQGAPTPETRRGRADVAPENEGLQGLSEDERRVACERRYPMEGLEGEAYNRQSAHFLACMPKGYGAG